MAQHEILPVMVTAAIGTNVAFFIARGLGLGRWSTLALTLAGIPGSYLLLVLFAPELLERLRDRFAKRPGGGREP
jgi:hypothetical protein